MSSFLLIIKCCTIYFINYYERQFSKQFTVYIVMATTRNNNLFVLDYNNRSKLKKFSTKMYDYINTYVFMNSNRAR